jgi:hypothetical protein
MIYLFESTESSQYSAKKIIIMKEPFDADALIREKESLKRSFQTSTQKVGNLNKVFGLAA